MGDTIQIKVDKSLQEVLEDLRKKVAFDIKSTYGLDTITVHGTLASKILAAKMKGIKVMNFRINKISLNKGILELI